MSTSLILSAMRQEVAHLLEKEANVVGDAVHAAGNAPARGVIGRIGQALSKGKGIAREVGEGVVKHEDKLELGGLGALGVVPAIEVAHGLKKNSVTGERDLGTAARGGAEIAGLTTLSAPYIAKVFGGIRGHH